MQVDVLVGAAIAPAVKALAELRIRVFADWPYLYDGDAGYEARYLAGYAETPRSIVVAARDGEAIVGAASGMPLADHDAAIAAAVERDGTLTAADTFYCAESVLLSAYRGQGLGRRFFDERERHARELGFGKVCFCAVERPDDHPARPPAARSLEPFWRGRGYRPLGEARTHLAWRDIGDEEESEKSLRLWWRSLGEGRSA